MLSFIAYMIGSSCVVFLVSLWTAKLIWHMFNTETELISDIYRRKTYGLVVNIAGGGSTLVGKLLSVPGASNVVIRSSVAYSQNAIDELLGKTPERYTSEFVSGSLAVKAVFDAVRLAQKDERFERKNHVGLGCTACLRSNGKGSAFVSIRSEKIDMTWRWSQGSLIAFRSTFNDDGTRFYQWPYRNITGSRKQQEQALAYNMLLILHELSMKDY